MAKKSEIIVKDVSIRTMKVNGTDYICITDIPTFKRSNSTPLGERLVKLNQIAIQQMRVLNGGESRYLLK